MIQELILQSLYWLDRRLFGLARRYRTVEQFGGIALIHLDGLNQADLVAVRDNLAESLRLLRRSDATGGDPPYALAHLRGVVAARPRILSRVRPGSGSYLSDFAGPDGSSPQVLALRLIETAALAEAYQAARGAGTTPNARPVSDIVRERWRDFADSLDDPVRWRAYVDQLASAHRFPW